MERGFKMTIIRMFMKAGLPVLAIVGVLMAAPAYAEPPIDNMGPPAFAPAIYADGAVWGTKAVALLRAPNGHNDQSFDALYVVTNGVVGQLPVAEAGPGNPDYNGGRWFTHTITWKMGATRVALTSYQDIQTHAAELMITSGSPMGGPPPYFVCPLLPDMVPVGPPV